MKKLLLQIILVFIVFGAMAQTPELIGTVQDAQSNVGVSGESILLINSRDATQRKGVLADVEGSFKLSNLKSGNYRLRISSDGYRSEEHTSEPQ